MTYHIRGMVAGIGDRLENHHLEPCDQSPLDTSHQLLRLARKH